MIRALRSSTSSNEVLALGLASGATLDCRQRRSVSTTNGPQPDGTTFHGRTRRPFGSILAVGMLLCCSAKLCHAADRRTRLVLDSPASACESTAFVHPAPDFSSGSTARFSVDVRQLPWVRRLAVDYAFDYQRVAAFFAGNPSDSASWRAAIAAAQMQSRPRRELTDIVLAQQAQRDAPS